MTVTRVSKDANGNDITNRYTVKRLLTGKFQINKNGAFYMSNISEDKLEAILSTLK